MCIVVIDGCWLHRFKGLHHWIAKWRWPLHFRKWKDQKQGTVSISKRMFYFNEKKMGFTLTANKRETAKSNDTFLKAVGTKGRWNRKVTLHMIHNTSRSVHMETILLAQAYLVEKDKPHWRCRKKGRSAYVLPCKPIWT